LTKKIPVDFKTLNNNNNNNKTRKFPSHAVTPAHEFGYHAPPPMIAYRRLKISVLFRFPYRAKIRFNNTTNVPRLRWQEVRLSRTCIYIYSNRLIAFIHNPETSEIYISAIEVATTVGGIKREAFGGVVPGCRRAVVSRDPCVGASARHPPGD